MSKWVIRAHFRHLSFNNFPMVWKTLGSIGFWPLQSLSEHSRVHRDSNSQGGSSFRSVRVHSLTLSFILGLPSWLATLQAFALVVSPRLRLWHQGKKIFILDFMVIVKICPVNLFVKYINLMNNYQHEHFQVFYDVVENIFATINQDSIIDIYTVHKTLFSTWLITTI
jgi:hypothetical protein